jgi:hypothetical protein
MLGLYSIEEKREMIFLRSIDMNKERNAHGVLVNCPRICLVLAVNAVIYILEIHCSNLVRGTDYLD